jgi:hypothetical protein
MRTSKGLQLAKELLKANMSTDLLALEIYDLLNLHQSGEKLEAKDKFILGLAYSEFYADGSDDQDYWTASEKRAQYLQYLGIDAKTFGEKVQSLFDK